MKKNKTSNSARRKQKRAAASKQPTVRTTTKLTVGIDLGDQNSAYCVLDAEGDVLSEGTVRSSESGFSQQSRVCRGAELRSRRERILRG